jgi:hypothetical protein
MADTSVYYYNCYSSNAMAEASSRRVCYLVPVTCWHGGQTMGAASSGNQQIPSRRSPSPRRRDAGKRTCAAERATGGIQAIVKILWQGALAGASGNLAHLGVGVSGAIAGAKGSTPCVGEHMDQPHVDKERLP